MSGGEGSETLPCPPVQVWPPSHPRGSRGVGCLDPQGGKTFLPDPQKRDQVNSEGQLTPRGPQTERVAWRLGLLSAGWGRRRTWPFALPSCPGTPCQAPPPAGWPCPCLPSWNPLARPSFLSPFLAQSFGPFTCRGRCTHVRRWERRVRAGAPWRSPGRLCDPPGCSSQASLPVGFSRQA